MSRAVFFHAVGCDDNCSLGKDDFYCNHFSMDMFLSLIIKVFRFVPTSEHVSSSMCQCTWRAKGTGGPPLLILPHFISSVLLVLQLALAVSILRHAVVISEGSSELEVLSKGPSVSLFDMFLTTRLGT